MYIDGRVALSRVLDDPIEFERRLEIIDRWLVQRMRRGLENGTICKEGEQTAYWALDLLRTLYDEFRRRPGDG